MDLVAPGPRCGRRQGSARDLRWRLDKSIGPSSCLGSGPTAVVTLGVSPCRREGRRGRRAGTACLRRGGTERGEGVVDLNIAGRLADISRAGLNNCRRSRRCSGDRYRSSTRRQQRCDEGQFDSHGRAPLHISPFVATETSQPSFIPTVGDLVRAPPVGHGWCGRPDVPVRQASPPDPCDRRSTKCAIACE